jgi:hypothetical protein
LLGVRRGILLLADDRPLLGELGIQLAEFFLAGGNLLLGVNGLDRAFRLAQSAIDALIGIDHEKIGTLVETVDRANLDAVHVFALDAAFGDYERHDLPFFSAVERDYYSILPDHLKV